MSAYVERCRQKLRDLRRRAALAIGRLTDEDVNWRPNEESNSIANLVVHMAGNLHQRLESGIGGAPDQRDRDSEFNSRAPVSRDQVLEILNQSFFKADEILAAVTEERLSEPQRIRDREVTVADVLFTVATHLSEHVGQILYIAKLRLGAGFGNLSIPHKR